MELEENKDEYLRQLKEKYGDRRLSDFTKESDTVFKYFTSVTEDLQILYTFDKVLAVGGTGIVHAGRHNHFDRPVVLKINRPNAESEGTSMVEREAAVLPTLSHPNIISVLDLGEHSEFPQKLTFIVEPFITGSKPFFAADEKHIKDTWLFRRLDNLKGVVPPTAEFGESDDTGQTIGLITTVLGEVARLFSQWASLLAHLHEKHANAENGYVYLDVKPENVLIDDNLHLTSIDYGSVEPLDSKDPTPIEVFFTQRYAHPDLIARKTHKPSSNRVRSSMKRSELRPELDYYALGMSLLEVLNEIACVRPHVVPQLPLYRSLHFLATRLLDGRNSKRQSDNHSYASQVFPGLSEADYVNLGYHSLDDVMRDLDKELGHWSLEQKVPELATYSKDIVRIVPGFNTVLTPRLKRLIEHPLVGRLKYTTQLGLVSLVYPTADHSRYDHALGSYTYTTYYVRSLFNDLGNPIFRNLVSAEDINAVLLAALLHDLGQYPLAHDLEEVHDRIFKHSRIGMELLKDNLADDQGRTLLQIIEDSQNGWRVPADALRKILDKHSKNLDFAGEDQKATLKTNVLGAIIDGQVDADKADYIIRDSARCELPYGRQLDVERLLRVLTVAIIPEETAPERRITLGVYDKGLVSAHAFGQARYELFSTVYWHHTSRIIKCMLQYATVSALPPVVFGHRTKEREDRELELRQQLLDFVKRLVPPFDVRDDRPVKNASKSDENLDLTAEPPQQVIEAVVDEKAGEVRDRDAAIESPWYPGIAWTDWLMLEWISKLPDGSIQSQNLIRGIQTRQLYKRIATLARDGPHSSLVQALDDLPWQERLYLCKKVHAVVSDRLKRDWAHLNTATPMDQNEFDRLCDSNLLILIDAPNPRKKAGFERPLGVVPELKERLYHQDGRHAAEDKAWKKIMGDMMEGSAPIRILCHPDVRNLVSAAFASTGANDKSAEDKIAEVVTGEMGQA